LASLKFSQSHRAADPKDPARIITTTTTTTFSMTREMARGICQHFMDAHLIENAADLTSPSFKERGIYMVTPKGTHMLERFITKNGISATHIAHIFAEQPIHVKMLHLERRSSDDEIIISKSVIEVIWRRVAGVSPNMTKLTDDELQQQLLSRWFNKPVKLEELNVEDGLVVRKVQKDDKKGDEFHFTALGLTNWLTEFTSCGGLDEAAELSGHLVRYGLISLVHDRGKVKDHNMVISVKAGGAGGGAGAMMVGLFLFLPTTLLPRLLPHLCASSFSNFPTRLLFPHSMSLHSFLCSFHDHYPVAVAPLPTSRYRSLERLLTNSKKANSEQPTRQFTESPKKECK
jgi:hypothetical protein